MATTLKNYIDNIINIETKHKLDASLEMLEHIDNINKHFITLKTTNSAEILTNVFGLLQSLFVGVDSLYNLVLSITKYKYYININQNPFLRQLKYVRNDVVGHPTNRKYASSGVGYTKLDIKSLTIDSLSYEVFRFRYGDLKIKRQIIDFKDLIDAYLNEKDIIINQLNAYINKTYTKINFSEEVKDLRYNINKDNINKLRLEFIKHYGNYSQHRFLWRLRLLEMTLYWHDENQTINELITYIQMFLAIKIERISFDLENKSSKHINNNTPKALRSFRNIMIKRPGLKIYLESLNDKNNPFYESDLEFLIEEITNKDVLEILKYLQNLEDNEKIYLIGTVLKKYGNK